VTLGSNILTLTQPSSFSTGDPVTGFGLPGGTTVSSVSGALVTLNQNAIASTSVVTTGTLQGNYTQIVVSSATGITPGMAVVGSYLPVNCQVVAVSGTTLTLSSPADLDGLVTPVASAVGTIGGSLIAFTFGTPLTVGWYVVGSIMPLSRRCQIINVLNQSRVDSSLKRVIRSTVATVNQNAGTKPLFTNTTWTFYIPTAIPSATYTFFATNQTYTFRANANIPFGSYPGVGTYSA